MNRRPERRVGLILLTVGLALAAGITSAGTAIAAGIDAAGVEFSGTTVERSRMAEIELPTAPPARDGLTPGTVLTRVWHERRAGSGGWGR